MRRRCPSAPCLMLGVLLVTAPGCWESGPECPSALQHYYAENHRLYPGDASPWDRGLQEGAAVAYCEKLHAEAAVKACIAEHQACGA